jgi:phosphatidylglycerophosphate synthase
MQAVIAIPDLETLRAYEGGPEFLLREIAGVPLLTRVVATGMRAGADSILLLWPEDVDQSIREKCLDSPLLNLLQIRTIVFTFNPKQPTAWRVIERELRDRFLWLPWNWVTNKYGLAISPSDVPPVKWDAAVLITKDSMIRSTRVRVVSRRNARGVSVTSGKLVSDAERFLVAHSGKPSDGIYSKFNRFLCRLPVRLLAHTRVTPNFVTLAGLLFAIGSAVLYSRGSYASYAAGAALFFMSGLIDDMDGMLARIKFRESAFGTWFEGFVDNTTYLLLFCGMTVGLYRQRGPHELMYGIALIAGCVLSVIVIALQRKRATAPDRPHEYSARMNSLFDGDSALTSKVARQIHIFVKKGVAVHYVLLFTLLGLLPLFLRLAALAANLTWSLGLYFTYRFFGKAPIESAVENVPSAA